MASLTADNEKKVDKDENEKSLLIFPTFLMAPFKVLNWLKKKHPSIVFSILMAFETFNFVGDCLQLQVVISINRLYSGDPYQLSGVFNKVMPWTLEWDLIETNPPMLGYALPWDGLASGATVNTNNRYVLNMNCDMSWRYSGKDFQGGSWYSTLTHISSDSHYLSINRTNNVHKSRRVCVRVQDVFDDDFLSYGQLHRYSTANSDDDYYHGNYVGSNNAYGPKHYLCPNNKTAIFDSSSYVIDVQPSTLSQEILQQQRTQTARPYNATLHYKKGWMKSVFEPYQCRVLSSIYMGTAVIFAVECLLIICQLCVGIVCLWRGRDADTRLFVTKIVEMPLVRKTNTSTLDPAIPCLIIFVRFVPYCLVQIGFLLAPCILTRNDWQLYANLDLATEEAGQLFFSPH